MVFHQAFPQPLKMISSSDLLFIIISTYRETAMATKVWCILVDAFFQCTLGDAFPVNVPSDCRIYDVKKKIKEVHQYDLADISVHQLCLWKLCKPQNSRLIKREGYLANLKRLDDIPEDEDQRDDLAWTLDEDESVSLHLSHLPVHKISVLAQLVAPSPTFHPIVTLQLSVARRLYQALWGNGLLDTILEQVPGRKEKCLSKSQVSGLQLRELGYDAKTLLVREEYETALKTFEDLPADHDYGGVAVVGQPGIGTCSRVLLFVIAI
jgi:hypothetical protein